MASYNKIIIVGRLTRDPELRYTAGGLAVTKFAVAVDRRFKNQQGERVTDFFDCSAFRQTAEFVSNYVTKGRMVLVEGSIEFNEATSQDGQKRRYTNVIADNVQTLDSQRDGGEGGAPGGGSGFQRNAGGNAGGNGGGNDGGYFPDEDAPASAPAPRAQAPQGGQGAGRPAPAPRPAAAAGGAAAPQQPRRPVEPAYPEDDFDDSDPFADQ
jgi:single-strand DNA-binding protein